MTTLRRMLAIWTPISHDGSSVFSTATSTTPVAGIYQNVPIEVFSGSLYARNLLAQGRRYVDATVSGIAAKLDALEDLLCHASNDQTLR